VERQTVGPAIWAIAETDNDSIRETSYEVLNEGRRLADCLCGQLWCVLIGDQLEKLVQDIGERGVDGVYVVSHPLLAHYNSDGYADALTDLIRGFVPFLVIGSDTPNGHDLMTRVSARLKAGIVTDCLMISVDEEKQLRFTKPVYQDKMHATITCRSSLPYMATVRPGVIARSAPGNCRQVQILRCEPIIQASVLRTRTLETIQGDPCLMDVGEADIVVAGGRGVGGRDGWTLIERVAKVLGASVGGTRIAMDMGCILRDRMIGQTGKNVSPRLYLAAGVSGTSHHIGGIKAGTMIAIDNDRHAPIFKHSDIAILGDLHEILPLLAERLEQRAAHSSRDNA
jgi:electron transfer flavoprotein alpha subunit